MTFNSRIKSELLSIPLGPPCCRLAEIYGILLYGHAFSRDAVQLMTGNPDLFRRIHSLSTSVFGGEVWDVSLTPGGKNLLSVKTPELKKIVFDSLNYDPAGPVTVHLNGWLIEKDCCVRAFFRGAFLSGGFVSDPAKTYHAELVTPHRALCREVFAILNGQELRPKYALRQGRHMIYWKESEPIEDYLTMCGASNAAMEIMEAKIVKDLRNRVNRKVNCEASNLSKTISATLSQIKAIDKISATVGLDSLPPALRVTAELRRDAPEASLSDLAGMFPDRISRSGLNHRLNRLIEIAEQIP